MLSLPLIQPPTSWHQPRHRRLSSPSPPPSSAQASAQHQQQSLRQRQYLESEKATFNARSPLAQLSADESAIVVRKAAVRTFGAFWIRPPGIAKTLQTMTEEEAERVEQAELERQERGLLDLQATQEAEEARMRAAEADGGEDGEEEERDLDGDIPDAEDGVGDATGDVTFNEDSMMEGSALGGREEGDDSRLESGEVDGDDEGEEERQEQYAELEEAELTGAAREQEDLGMDVDLDMGIEERNLDDSIPEAGSYQHTDTEIEDSTDSESEVQNSFAAVRSTRRSAAVSDLSATRPVLDAQHLRFAPPTMQQQQQQQQQQQRVSRLQFGGTEATGALPRSPGNLDLSMTSSVQDSSLMASSPVMQRTNAGSGRGRAGAGRRSRRS